MKNNRNSIKGGTRKSFTADVVTLVTGTTIAQIITVVSSPVITRLYGAEAFGLAALFTSLIGIISIIACLSYEASIMIPKADGEAANLLALCFLLVSCTSLALIPILWLIEDPLLSLLNAYELKPYMWLIPPMTFLIGSFSAINYWNSRMRQFRRLSITQITKVASTTATQLGAGFVGQATGGSLIGASIVGQMVATSTLGYQAWISDNGLFKQHVAWKKIIEVLKTYRDYPKFGVLTTFINTISLQMPIFLLSAYFTKTVVGYYSLGFMVLTLPMTVIGGSITQVFFQRAAEANHESKEALASVVESTLQKLIIFGFLPITLISIIGSDLFTLVFGSGWAEAGTYAQILSFWILVQFIASPMTILFNVQDKLRVSLYFQILMFSSRILPMILGGILGDLYLTLILLSLSGVLFYLFQSVWLLKGVAVSIRSILDNVAKALMLGTLVLSIVFFSKFVLQQNSTVLTLLAIAGILLYYYVMVIKGNVREFLRSSDT